MKKFVLLTLFALPLFAADVTGRFEPGQTYREPERDAPPAVSRMFVRHANGRTVDLPATGGSGMIITSSAHATLRTPTGDELTPSDRGSRERGIQRFYVDGVASREVIHIDRTEAAAYQLVGIDAPNAVVVAAEPDSRLTMTTTVGPLSRMPGDAVTLKAFVRDGDTPVAGAHVVARLVSPSGVEGDAIELRETAAGTYVATINELPSSASGFWTVRYEAEGTTAQGVAFARNGSNDFMNEALTARLGNVRTRVEGGVLHVVAPAEVLAAGRFRLDVIVASARDANGERRGVAWGEAERTLERGRNEIALDVPLQGGSADFVDVRLLSLDTMGLAGRVTR